MYNSLERFTALLYGSNDENPDINGLRYSLFCIKKVAIESQQLPPCRDSLQKHCDKANYQVAIWHRSLVTKPVIPSPVQHGWILCETDSSGDLTVDWMSGAPTPEAVLELLSCQCTRACREPNSSCFVNGLRCTDMCIVKNCDSQPALQADESDVEQSSDDELYKPGY